MGKKENQFKDTIKYCLSCGVKLVLNNTRDIERKKYCSYSCHFKYLARTLGLKRPPMTKEARLKAAKTISLRMAQGLIPKPPRRPARIKEYCSKCGKLLSYKTLNKLCKTCFSTSRINKIQCICENCGRQFEKIPCIFKVVEHHFCSRPCFYKWKKNQPSQAKQIATCSMCGKNFEKYQSQLKNETIFCSRKCLWQFQSEHLRGEKATGYIDGRTPLRLLLKNSIRYATWKKEVLLKDGFKCTECNTRLGFLHAHHLISFRKIFDEFLAMHENIKDKTELLDIAFKYKRFWDVNNGVTLCINCHQKCHPDINLTMGDKKNAINNAD